MDEERGSEDVDEATEDAEGGAEVHEPSEFADGSAGELDSDDVGGGGGNYKGERIRVSWGKQAGEKRGRYALSEMRSVSRSMPADAPGSGRRDH